MKTKIYKIAGVTLALVLVFGLMGAFLPVGQVEAADPGTTPNMWQATTIPSGATQKIRASNVADIAVASDGKTAYAVDTQTAGILQTTTNGARWTVLPNPGAGYVAPPRLVAVAPDDPNAVAIVDSFNGAATVADGQVWISNNGGTTWAMLNQVVSNGSAGGTAVTMGITVGPARSGTILGRDYAVAVSDGTPGAFAGGDVLFMGLNTAWVSASANAAAIAASTFDFTSVEMSPGFLGDRCVVAVGSNAGGTRLFIIQTSDVAPLATLVAPPGAVLVEVTSTLGFSARDYDAAGAAAGATIKSDIALPSDFDPTTVPGRRSFLSWTAVGAANFDDVYRVDNSTVRKLQTGAAAANGTYSIAYSGTISGGTLIAGEAAATGNATLVWHTEDPNVSQPSWSASAKSPTGTTNCVVGIDPADATLCYAGNSGVENAFHASTNGALSFNQRGMVDTAVAALEDVMPSPDGSVVFLATNDGVDASLWKSSVPAEAGSWERVRLRTAAVGYIVRLNPEWDDAPALFYCDRGATDVQRSVDGGNIFSTRVAPANIGDIAVENADTLYLGDIASGNLYKSTNGAWFFGLPVPTNIAGTINDLAMAPSYPEKPVPGNLLVGGTVATSVSRTWTGGSFFAPVTPFPGGAVSLTQVMADVDFANNKTIYCGSAIAGSGIWRFQLDTSTVWEQIHPGLAYVNPAGIAIGARSITGLAMAPGAAVLYGAWTDGASSGAARSLVPEIPVIASWIFDQMDVGSAPGVLFNIAPNSLKASTDGNSVSLWAIDTVANALMAYHDTMALYKAEVNVPAEVPVDSVSGMNARFTVSWNQTSNETDSEVEIFLDPAGNNMILTSAPYGGAGPPWYVAPNPLAPSWTVAQGVLSAGSEYFVRVRVRDQVPNDAIRSAYSSMHRFEVQGGERVEVSYLGVQPLGPAPGATGVPLSPGFTWSPYAKTTRYEFQLGKDAGMSDVVAEAKVSTTGYKYDGTLDWNATFFWRARGIEPTITDWSPVSSFTTEKKPVEPTPPVQIVTPTPAEPVVTPAIIWAIIAIGAILVIAVIVLIVRTRRTV